MKSLLGGAMYIEEASTNKLTTDSLGKYKVSKSSFNGCQAIAGGALYLKNP
jgi:subtilase family serine protease